jgi:23S rRNA pseudouridine2605 synthase
VKVRLQKLLAEAGFGSRRGCEELIRAGRVSLGGHTATLGESADPHVDSVAVDGQPIAAQAKEYWLLNKPAGVLSAVVDARGRETVTDYIPTRARVYPVGRLDLNSTGLLLLTNDGDLAVGLLHPRYHVEKEYIVTVRGEVPEHAIERVRSGVVLEEGTTSPARVARLHGPSQQNGFTTLLQVVIHEGRKRQVKRMLEAVGHRVTALHRARFATLTDAGLACGQARRLTPKEVAEVRSLAGGG